MYVCLYVSGPLDADVVTRRHSSLTPLYDSDAVLRVLTQVTKLSQQVAKIQAALNEDRRSGMSAPLFTPRGVPQRQTW